MMAITTLSEGAFFPLTGKSSSVIPPAAIMVWVRNVLRFIVNPLIIFCWFQSAG
jgi:hypothetical protein